MNLFHDSLYDYHVTQPSYWENSTVRNGRFETSSASGNIDCEVAVIGGGYTGLSAAYHLAKFHSVDVAVLEAGSIGWGASGRNGGFCCIGGTMIGAKRMVVKYGLEEARKYYQSQIEAVDLVRGLIKEEAIDADVTGDCEMVVAERPDHLEELRDEAEVFSSRFGVESHVLSEASFKENHYDAPHVHGALVQRPGFGLHPLKYCLGLADAADRAGATLFPNSRVTNWAGNQGRHELEIERGGRVRAKHVFVACNGFLSDNLHKGLAGRTLPLQSHIIVTRPLSSNELGEHRWQTQNPAVNSRNVYFYYRLLSDNRLLIGGRSDFVGTPEGADKTRGALKRSIAELWPRWLDVEIEYSWRGLVCFTRRLSPAIGRLEADPSVHFAFGYHGNGVNTATWAGRELAKWYAQGNNREDAQGMHLPAVLRGQPGRFPFAPFRKSYGRLGVSWHRLKDLVS